MPIDHPVTEHLESYVNELGSEMAEARFESLRETDEAPYASLSQGMAGAAFAVWHWGQNGGGELAQTAPADMMSDTLKYLDEADAFIGGTEAPSDYSPGNLYFSAEGPHFVAQMVGAEPFAVPNLPGDFPPELMSGKAGHMIASCLIAQHADPAALDHARAMWPEIVAAGEASMHRDIAWGKYSYTGIAHGLGGMHYALLVCRKRLGLELPDWFETSLQAFVALRRDRKDTPWPWLLGAPDQEPVGGWCNGSPGLTLLFAVAYEELGDQRYLDAARVAAEDTWDHQPNLPDLCCGVIGEAYAMLAMSRVDDPKRWLPRAYDRAALALGAEQNCVGLVKGDGGALCLGIDLLSDRSTMAFLDIRQS